MRGESKGSHLLRVNSTAGKEARERECDGQRDGGGRGKEIEPLLSCNI